MVSEKVTIVNPSGLHLLNAVNLSNSVSRYKSSMSFTYENNGMQGTVNLKESGRETLLRSAAAERMKRKHFGRPLPQLKAGSERRRSEEIGT